MTVAAKGGRKRLQRVRESVETFTRAHCGLVRDDAPCRCHRRVAAALSLGRVCAERPLFAEQSGSFLHARELISRVEQTQRVVELHRRAHPRGPSRDIARLVLAALEPVAGPPV